MKFNILNFNQRRALELKLDLKDLAILGWIKDFWPGMKKKIIDGEEYGWVQYDYLIKDIPIVEIDTPHGLYKRMRPLVKIGLLKHKGVKDKSGSFSYYKLTEKIMELLDDEYLRRGSPEKDDGNPKGDNGGPKKDGPVRPKRTTKDNPTINPSTISISSKEEMKKLFLDRNYKSNYERCWNFYQKIGWTIGKSKIVDRVAVAEDWEAGFMEKNPDLYKTTLNSANSESTVAQSDPIKINNDDPLWLKLSEVLRSDFEKDVYEKWLSKLNFVDVKDGNITLAAPSKFLRDWIKREHLENLKSSFQQAEESLKSINIIHV